MLRYVEFSISTETQNDEHFIIYFDKSVREIESQNEHMSND